MITITFKKARFQKLCSDTVVGICDKVHEKADDIGEGIADTAGHVCQAVEGILNCVVLCKQFDKGMHTLVESVFDKKLAKKFQGCFKAEGLEELRDDEDEVDDEEDVD